jgi:hypothetical protein
MVSSEIRNYRKKSGQDDLATYVAIFEPDF